MRIDHFAYQRGTQAAGFGLLLQAAFGLTLLLFGLLAGDTTFTFASVYVLLGLLVWLSLVIIFQQHKLERLEALEEDELAAAREGTSSIFDASDEQRVAARRLGLMHKWMMPIVSLAIAAGLIIGSVAMIFRMGRIDAADLEQIKPLALTGQVGWGIAVCLAFALVSFIFSRFIAGMAKQEAWQNLRGGAGYMVGNALVLLAIAVGLGFRIFGNDNVMVIIGWIIPGYMLIIAVEIVLNFVLNLYRPRIPGEVPRPAYDSKLLSLLAAPDSIVRSLNEAVNYQFGFDISSSWGYQLLLRSIGWLVLLGVMVIVLLNTMVVVEPHQQAIRLRHGEIVGEVHGSGIMWKWPWPRDTAAIYDVERVRELELTGRRPRPDDLHQWSRGVNLWSHRHEELFRPFLVGAMRIDEELDDFDEFEGLGPEPADAEEFADLIGGTGGTDSPMAGATAAAANLEEVTRVYSLLDAEIIMQYRIRSDADGRGLLDYLSFAPDVPPVSLRRTQRSTRQDIMRHLALREISNHLADLSLDEALSRNRRDLARTLREKVQRAFDEINAGVEVLAINMPMMRPSGDVGAEFHELAFRRQSRLEHVARAERSVVTQLATLVGDPETGRRVMQELDEYDQLRDELGSQHEDVVEKRQAIENLLLESSGLAGTSIRLSEANRWNELMTQRAQAERVRSLFGAYSASPRLYEQREIMRVYSESLRGVRKYLVGIDPERAEIDLELKELSPLVDFSLAVGEGDGNE